MDYKQISSVAATVFVAISAALPQVALSATTVNLSHGGASASIDLDTATAGMNSWVVDASPANQLNKQWFYYRVGSGGLAQPINTIGGLTFVNPDSQTLSATYANSAFSVTVTYVMTGAGSLSGAADIFESISVLNTSGTNDMDFHLFQYSDFNLSGTAGGDSVVIGNAFDSVIQWDGVSAIAETAAQPPANRAEAAFAFTTLNNLNSVPGYNLNNNIGPISGDVTWSFQWDALVDDNGISFDVIKDKQMGITPVPEPTTVSMLVVALGAAGFLRRRR